MDLKYQHRLISAVTYVMAEIEADELTMDNIEDIIEVAGYTYSVDVDHILYIISTIFLTAETVTESPQKYCYNKQSKEMSR